MVAAFDVSVRRAQSAQFEFFSRESRSNARGVGKKKLFTIFPRLRRAVSLCRANQSREKKEGVTRPAPELLSVDVARGSNSYSSSVGGAVAALDLSGRSNSNFVDRRKRSNAVAASRPRARAFTLRSESLKASQPKLLGRGAGTKNSNFSPKTDALQARRPHP